MRKFHRTCSWSLLALLLLARPATGAQIAPRDKGINARDAAMARLVPADAIVVLGTPSLETYHALHTSYGALFDRKQPPTRGETLSFLPRGLARFIAPSRPVWAALSPSGSFLPRMTYIVPVTDIKALRDGLRRLTIHTDGRYAGVSTDPAYVPSGRRSALTAPLPMDRSLAVRLKPEQSLATLLPFIHGALQGMVAGTNISHGDGVASPEDGRAVLRALSNAVEEMEWLQAAVSVEGGHLSLELAVDVRAESTLADIPAARSDSLQDMLDWLDADAPIHVVAALNTDAVARIAVKRTLAAAGSLSDEAEDSLMESMALLRQLGARCGDVCLGNLSTGEEVIESTWLFDAEDPNALLEAMSQSLVAALPVDPTDTDMVEGRADGFDTVSLSAATPSDTEEGGWLERLADKGGLWSCRLDAAPGRVLLSSGGRTVTDAPRDAAVNQAPQDLVEVLQQLSAYDSRLALRMDTSQLPRRLSDVVLGRTGDDSPAAGEQPPSPLLLWVGGRGKRWIGGLEWDWDGGVLSEDR